MTPSILRAALEEALTAGVTFGRQRAGQMAEAELRAWVEAKAAELLEAYAIPDRAQVTRQERDM